MEFIQRNTFLQCLHPLTTVLLISLYTLFFIFLENPIYILIMSLSIISMAYIDGSIKQLIKYGRIIIPFALILALLNPLVVSAGETIIYKGYFNYPIFGQVKITMEAIYYGIFASIKIIGITLLFGFGNLIIHPDRAFSFFSNYLGKSALLMNMTIRLFPTISNSYLNIKEVDKLRGNRINDNKFKKTIKNRGSIVNILFLSSIEDSVDMAESMYSRGYGVYKKRSSYFDEKFTFWDKVLISFIIIMFVYLNYFMFKGLHKFSFYPRVDNIKNSFSSQGVLFIIALFFPSLMNWWWKNWK